MTRWQYPACPLDLEPDGTGATLSRWNDLKVFLVGNTMTTGRPLVGEQP
jgi:hypothetical protein